MRSVQGQEPSIGVMRALHGDLCYGLVCCSLREIAVYIMAVYLIWCAVTRANKDLLSITHSSWHE
jgi:hypothetical protein